VLRRSVASGHAPFTVNSSTKVKNLNADLLDGLNAEAIAWTFGGHSGAMSLPNAKGTWTTVAKTSFTTSTPSEWVMQGQDNVAFTSGGQATSSLVNLRFLVNGKEADNLVFSSTVGAGAVQGLTGIISCNGMPAGTYTIQLQVEAYANDGTFASRVGTLSTAGQYW
jgi:hypothetical protein